LQAGDAAVEMLLERIRKPSSLFGKESICIHNKMLIGSKSKSLSSF
jgi:hypothetical protein